MAKYQGAMGIRGVRWKSYPRYKLLVSSDPRYAEFNKAYRKAVVFLRAGIKPLDTEERAATNRLLDAVFSRQVPPFGSEMLSEKTVSKTEFQRFVDRVGTDGAREIAELLQTSGFGVEGKLEPDRHAADHMVLHAGLAFWKLGIVMQALLEKRK